MYVLLKRISFVSTKDSWDLYVTIWDLYVYEEHINPINKVGEENTGRVQVPYVKLWHPLTPQAILYITLYINIMHDKQSRRKQYR